MRGKITYLLNFNLGGERGGRGGGSMQILFYIQPTLSQKYAEKFGLELMIVYHRSYQ